MTSFLERSLLSPFIYIKKLLDKNFIVTISKSDLLDDELRSEMEEHVTQHADNWHTLVAELSMLAMGAELQKQSKHEGES